MTSFEPKSYTRRSHQLHELTEDPNFNDRVTLIRAPLAHPQCLKVEQLYFVPQMRPWPA